MDHPYRKFERTPLWTVIETALSELAQNQDVTLHTTSEHVIGFLCQRLVASSSGDQVALDKETALVLFDLLASREDLATVLNLEPPERNALWSLEAALERKLGEPFSPEYAALLQAARRALVERAGE
jgi:hypothetical protein